MFIKLEEEKRYRIWEIIFCSPQYTVGVRRKVSEEKCVRPLVSFKMPSKRLSGLEDTHKIL